MYTDMSTGEKLVVWSIDWMRFTVFCEYEKLCGYLEYLDLVESLGEARTGGLGFETRYDGLNGFQVYCDPYQAAKDAEGVPRMDYCSVSFPGKAMGATGLDDLARWLVWLLQSGLEYRFTRVDFAYDTQLFSVKDVKEAYELEKISSLGENFEEVYKKTRKFPYGHTLYFGDRQSLAFLRIYHKTDGVSFGDEAFTRVEMECKAERADLFMRMLLTQPLEDWAAMAGGWLAGWMVIVDYDWWDNFVAGLEAAWVKISQPAPTLDAMQKWLEKSVAATMATVLAARSKGDEIEMFKMFMGWVEQGMERLSSRQAKLIAAADMDVNIVISKLRGGQVEF